jgi:hypothetical protein
MKGKSKNSWACPIFRMSCVVILKHLTNVCRLKGLAGLLLALVAGALAAPSARAGCGDHLFPLTPNARSDANSALAQPPASAASDAQLPAAPKPPCHGPNCSSAPPQPLSVPAATTPTVGDEHGALVIAPRPPDTDPKAYFRSQPAFHPLHVSSPLERPPRF